MWIVGTVGDGSIGEEAVIEKGAFEKEVGKRVKEMPNKDDPEFGGCGRMEEREGGNVGGYEESEGCEEGKDGCLVNYEGGGCGLRGHCSGR